MLAFNHFPSVLFFFKKKSPTNTQVLVNLFETLNGSPRGASRVKHLKRFRKRVLGSDTSWADHYEVYRLVLPDLDKQVYGLKETACVPFLLDALGIDRSSSRAKELAGWRSSASGVFPVAATNFLDEYLRREDGGVTVRDVTDGLDALASAHSLEEKARAVSQLMQRMTKLQLRWFLGIVLRDVKTGMSDRVVFRDYHPDAEQCFSVCCDMKRLFQQIQPHYALGTRCPAFGVHPGEMVRAMCATRCASAADVHKRVSGNFYTETKFDGERMQLHKNEDAPCNYFSRAMHDHGPPPVEGRGTRGYVVFDPVASRQLRLAKCILDGEFVLWNTSLRVFEPFGFVASFTRAAREGCVREDRVDVAAARTQTGSARVRDPPRLGDLELRFMAFDILYTMVDGQYRSVVDRPLRERKHLLRAAVEDAPEGGHPIAGHMRGGIYVVVPGMHCRGESWGLEAVEEAISEAVAADEEGIVVKSAESRWEPGERGAAWLKFKPDYFGMNDLDMLVMGVYLGTGSARGGRMTEFLMGVMESQRPVRFVTCCRVKTGLSAQQVECVDALLRRNDGLVAGAPGRPPPAWCVLSDKKRMKRELWPHYWVREPQNSVVFTIAADVRCIRSDDFATDFSLRFPRISRVRTGGADEKPWYEALTHAQMNEQVHQNEGRIGTDAVREKQPLPSVRQRRGMVAAQFRLPPAGETRSRALEGVTLAVADRGLAMGERLEIQRLIRAHGGELHAMRSPDVTYVIAPDPDAEGAPAGLEGALFELICGEQRVPENTVLTVQWLHECARLETFVEPQPRHRLYVPQASRMEGCDEFGDSLTRTAESAEDAESDVMALLRLAKRRRFGKVADDPADIEDQFPSLRVPVRCIFRRVVAYVIPSSLSESLREFDRRHLHMLFTWHGGGFAEYPNASVTHVVVSGRETLAEGMARLGDVQTQALNECLKRGPHVVREEWVHCAIRDMKRPSELLYGPESPT